MSSILTDLEAALEAKQEAARQMRMAFEAGEPFMRLRIAYDASWKALERLLTDDTIRALLDVAEEADALPCIDLDREYPTGRCDDCERDALCLALTPLVKEATDG